MFPNVHSPGSNNTFSIENVSLSQLRLLQEGLLLVQRVGLPPPQLLLVLLGEHLKSKNTSPRSPFCGPEKREAS